MVVKEERAKRLIIFLFYDKDGIIDNYIPTLFEGLKEFYEKLCFVVNGKLQDEGKEKLEKYVTDFLVRENKGFDVWGYKEGLEFYGWEELKNYDEVILMNYTIFGPLYPFSEMFDTMNKKDLDFWGITKHHEVDFDVFGTCKYGYIPEHIQSSFLVIRQSLLKTKDYQNMWKNMPMINSYAESVGLYEAIFTKEFNEKGYKSGVYIDTTDLEGYTRYPLMMMSDELIINRRCPIIKLKSFSQNYMDILTDTFGSCTLNSYNFIEKKTNYDTDLIWENILRTSNMASIKRLMHLNYILPTEYEKKKIDVNKDKLLLIFHIHFEDSIDESMKYMKSMPLNSDILITVSKIKLKEKLKEKIKELPYKNIEIKMVENRGKEISSLLVVAKDRVMNYNYVCFMHDKKDSEQIALLQSFSFRHKYYESNLSSKEYVMNILGLFKENKKLGMLMPPLPNHGNYFHMIGNEWGDYLKETEELAKKLGLKIPIYWGEEPISPLGTMFWFRPEAMKKLFDYDWKYEEISTNSKSKNSVSVRAIERIYGFVIQDAGYYGAWVMTENVAKVELTNLNYSIRQMNKTIFMKSFTTSLYGMIRIINDYQKKIFSKNNFLDRNTEKEEEKKENLKIVSDDFDLEVKKKLENDREKIIVLENISMEFKVTKERIFSLKEFFISFLKNNLKFEKFKALREINLEIFKGDVIGIIGDNGSGKSTLLKIISGIINPSKGKVTVKGTVSPLIELGAGFDSELSGRENIFLNGYILGYSKRELEEKIDEIIEFSELKKFIDTPLKNYSSGMIARLGFAIATIIKPEILIVDEILSVGDIKFQRKSEKRIKDLMKLGSTVIFVSHSIDQIEQICDKVIWLEKGKIRKIGKSEEVCQEYRENSFLGGKVNE